jgi:acetyl-CoA/propionyl-CoA carboxylase biotin carboxyl carrier protein
VLRVVAAAGKEIGRGETVCIVEAMKMENELVANRDGTVESLAVGQGDAIKIGDLVAVIT